MKKSLTHCFLLSFSILLLILSTQNIGYADDFEAEKDSAIEYVTVIGSKSKAYKEAGSADYISVEDLEDFLHFDVMRVLREAPGVYVQEEEGFGLRPNIGIRGSGADRSSRITLLEDGVLIAPAPYSAPSAYYFPTQQRMHAVEVLKGPSAIRVGSRTVGGAINFVSTPIPDENQGEITAAFGTNSTNQLLARYGGKAGDFGYLFEFTNYGSDGFKSIPQVKSDADGFDLQDYLAKFSYDLASASGANNHFELKLSKTEQDADSSYLGLTQADFDLNPYQRYAASQNDNIKTDHEQVQLNYVYTPASEAWQLGVTAYNNKFARNWYKLHTTSTAGLTAILEDPASFATEFGWLTGDIDSPDDALEIRANNREYYGRGLQAEFNTESYIGDTSILWTAGARYHQDEEDRFQDQDAYRIENRQLVLTTDAAPGSKTNRISNAKATSAYLEADINLGKLMLTPGLRYESIELTREDYSTSDPTRTAGPSQVRNNKVNVFIPGLGASYELSDKTLLLAGVHKGFNPPGPGSASDEEESTNFELGFRYESNTDDTYLLAEVIGFYNDYDNIVGTVTASTGGTGAIGDQFDGGETTVSGFEVDIARDISLSNGLNLPLRFTHTWTTQFEFDNSFNSGFDPWGEVIAGDELPYIPEHQFRASIGLEGARWSTTLVGNFTGERRTVAGQNDSDVLDSHFILDLAADYQWNEQLRLFTRLENALDKEYIAAARPHGLRPGKDRAMMLGFNYKF